jgi:hypothetical protein
MENEELNRLIYAALVLERAQQFRRTRVAKLEESGVPESEIDNVTTEEDIRKAESAIAIVRDLIFAAS